MPDFNVVLNENGTLDIFVNGERYDFDLTPEDLKDFAEYFINSNTNQ